MAFTLVSSLMEGAVGFGGLDGITDFGTFGSVSEAAAYTLESGAGLIASQCIHELHEIFECAIVNTSEAELRAHMEGYNSVEESVQFSAVFEAEEEKAGNKIILFLKKLGDRVAAFLINIATKLTSWVHNYDKWFEKHLKAMEKAGTVKLDVKDWNSDKMIRVSSDIETFGNDLSSIMSDVTSHVMDAVEEKITTEDFNKYLDDLLSKFTNKVAGTNATPEFLSQMNGILWKQFCPSDKAKDREVNARYVQMGMTAVKRNADNIKSVQKKYNTTYKKAVKDFQDLIKKCKKDATDSDTKKGYSQFAHKAVSTLSKIQSLINAYANCGYRAVMGMANESIRIGNALISKSEKEENRVSDDTGYPNNTDDK